MLPDIQRNKSGLYSDFQRSMNRLMKDFFDDLPVAFSDGSDYDFVPKMTMKDGKDKLVVSAELPGIEEKDVDVQIADDFLTIKGEKHAESEATEGERSVSECSFGSFERSVRLPQGIMADKAHAKFDKGILTIELPKSEKAGSHSRKIPIKH